MSGSELLCLEAAGLERPLTVGLLDGEPAGVVCTRVAGAVELAATLEWPPDRDGYTSVIDLLPAAGPRLRSSLSESAGGRVTTISGELRSLEEEALRDAVEEALRAAASVAAAREAALRTRVLRASRAWCPEATAVQALARRLWESGVEVGFGASWSPADPGLDIAVGCGGGRERMLEALSAPRVERVGAAR